MPKLTAERVPASVLRGVPDPTGHSAYSDLISLQRIVVLIVGPKLFIEPGSKAFFPLVLDFFSGVVIRSRARDSTHTGVLAPGIPPSWRAPVGVPEETEIRTVASCLLSVASEPEA
jgi:hypothetical protein